MAENRRKVLQSVGSAMVVAVAGCTGSTGENTPTETQTTTPKNETLTTLTHSQRLEPENNDYGSFGRSVSVSGEWLVVGVAGAEPNTPRLGNAAVIYRRQDSTWEAVEQLPSTDDFASGFGSSVIIDGDRMLVGTSNNVEDPAEYTTALFTQEESSWQRTGELDPNESDDYIGYGEFAALDGTTAFVTAYRENIDGDSFRGSVYAFTETDEGWQQRQELGPTSDGNDDRDDYFGRSVSISGETAVIGAMGDTVTDEDSTGAAYIFEQQGSDWTQTDVLAPDSLDTIAGFGSSVAIGPEHVLVGAKEAYSGDGAVYAYRRTSSGLEYSDPLPPDGLEPLGEVGFSMDMNGSRLLAGAPGGTTGSAHLYEYREGKWEHVAKLILENGDGMANFGHSVSLYSDTAVVGALRQSVPTGDGAVYTFDIGDEIE
jgi:hypothetical protein